MIAQDKALTGFQEVIDHRHEYARRWKEETGGKVIGYLCTYVPEEIIYAAGMLPVRILGSHEPQDLTESHIYSMYCSLCRDCLGQGLKGEYDYLDGIVFAFSCIHMCQTFDSWVRHIPIPFQHMLFMPSNLLSPHAKELFIQEVKRFKEALEAFSGKAITPEAIAEGVEVYNTNRRLLRRLYGRRKADPPPISGAEVLQVVLSSMFMDKRQHNRLLQGLLRRLPQQGEGEPRPRVITIGSENDDVALIDMIEGLGASVVTDDQCAGTRYFWNTVEKDGDLIEAIASRYVTRPPCPMKDLEGKTRIPYLLSLVKKSGAAGAILLQQKFCDPHAYDAPFILKALKEKGVNTLTLEYDIIVPVGQYRTRIEAFLEMLGATELP